MNLEELVKNPDLLKKVSADIANKVENTGFKAVSNTGLTPDQLMSRIKNFSIDTVGATRDPMAKTLVDAVKDFG